MMGGFVITLPASRLRQIVAFLSKGVEQALIEITPDGILKSEVVDTSHVLMMSIEVPLSKGTNYALSGAVVDPPGESGKVLVSLERLRGAIKYFADDDQVSLIFKGSGRDLLVESGAKKRTLHLDDLSEAPKIRIPILKFPARVTVRTQDFVTALKMVGEVDDHVLLEIHRDAASKAGELRVLSTPSQEEKVDAAIGLLGLEATKPVVKSAYPLDYLSALFGDFSPEAVTLQMDDEYVLRVDFSLADGHAYALLAPRIGND